MKLGRFGELVPLRGFSRVAYSPLRGTSMWRTHDGLQVVSANDIAFLPGTNRGEVGPHWHLSVSRTPERSLAVDVPRVVEAFAMPAFDEDGRPGIERHLWCPRDEAHRAACQSIASDIVADVDQWTDEKEPCRGCSYSLLSKGAKPCPIHGSVDARA